MQRSSCANEFSNFGSSSPPSLLRRPRTQPQALSPPKTWAGRSLGCPGELKGALGAPGQTPQALSTQRSSCATSANPAGASIFCCGVCSFWGLFAGSSILRTEGGVQVPPWCCRRAGVCSRGWGGGGRCSSRLPCSLKSAAAQGNF